MQTCPPSWMCSYYRSGSNSGQFNAYKLIHYHIVNYSQLLPNVILYYVTLMVGKWQAPGARSAWRAILFYDWGDYLQVTGCIQGKIWWPSVSVAANDKEYKVKHGNWQSSQFGSKLPVSWVSWKLSESRIFWPSGLVHKPMMDPSWNACIPSRPCDWSISLCRNIKCEPYTSLWLVTEKLLRKCC